MIQPLDPPSSIEPKSDREKEQDEQEIREKRTASAHVVYRAISEEADEELKRTSAALAWSGLAAGLSMGFSLVAEGLLCAHLPDAPWRPLVSKFGYSIGFLIVILGRQQLFTENTLTPILPLLRDRSLATLKNVMRLWLIVLVMNLIGVALFALAIATTNILSADVKESLLFISREAVSPGFTEIVLRAIFAGWLIALMVWLLPVAETARIWVIIILTYVIGLGQFSHVIAGSVKAFYLAATGMSSWLGVVGRFIIPALIGNILGGVALVAALNYAQAAPEEERS